MITFATVRALALALPDTEEGTIYGTTAFKVRGKMFACRAIHPSAEPGTLAVRIAFDQRDELIAAQPEVYYFTDHYVNYPAMLVRLSRVHRDALRDLLAMARLFVLSTSTRRATKPTRRRGHA